MVANVWGKWFYRDWLSDPNLRICGLAARGLWIDMICLIGMNAGRAGHLEVGGRRATDEMIAAAVGQPLDLVKQNLQELEDNCVFSRAEDGAIMCRRMVREAERSEIYRANGKRGGNPALKKKNDKTTTSAQIPAPTPTPIGGDGITRYAGNLVKQNPGKPEARSQKPEEESGGGGDARAAPVAADRSTLDLTERIIEAAGADPSKAPAWMTAAVEVRKWVAAGYDPDLDVMPAVRSAMANRTSPPETPRYFFKAIARHQAERLATLPTIDATPRHSNGAIHVAAHPLSRDDEERRRRDRDRTLLAGAFLRGVEPDGGSPEDLG